MSANATTAAPTGRKKIAQGKARSAAALGHDSKNISSPEGAKEGDNVSYRIALDRVARHHSGNSKLIKGKLHDAPADNLFPAFSATGQDVWRDAFDREGDAIIISAVGARCGKCFLAKGRWSAIANTHVVWPDPEKAEIKFLWYLLNDEQFWIRSGSAQPFVAVRKTFEKEIFIPPLPEQRRIVAEIEKQFTRLEAGVAALRRVQANLHRYRAAVLKAACEGKAWGKTTIRDSIQIIDYRGRTPPYSESGIPHLRSSNIRNDRIIWENLAYVTEETYDAYMTRGLPQEGDVLFTTEAPMGEVALAPKEKFSLAQRVMILRPKPNVFNSRFLMIQLMSPQFQARLGHTGTGSTVTGVSSRNFQPMQLAVPPMAEQERIVAEVERRLSVVEELSALVTANLQRATRLRQSILQKAFTGKLV